MRKLLLACTLALAIAGAVGANDDGGFAYKKTAAVPVLMEYMVKPSMDSKHSGSGAAGGAPVGVGGAGGGRRAGLDGQARKYRLST